METSWREDVNLYALIFFHQFLGSISVVCQSDYFEFFPTSNAKRPWNA